jgi:hypothetical protein
VPSIEEWLRVRAYLQERRHELGNSAAALYPAARQVEGTGYLAAASWIPAAPLPLDAVTLSWTDAPGRPSIAGRDGLAWDRALTRVLPARGDGPAYASYSAAVAKLTAPRVFENRSTYRLDQARFAGAAARLSFGPGRYFDNIDVGAACAHEYAAITMGVLADSALRDLVGEPWLTSRRPVNVAVSTLALRVDRERGTARFPLHWRDPRLVGHAGGLYQVIPVGMFQASSDEPGHQANDFDLWRGMLREFSEELLGTSEDYGPGAPVDYARWPFARQMNDARAAGAVRPWLLGLGVDPLTFATDVLTVVTFDAPVFDRIFGALVSENAEGTVIFGAGRDLEFTRETIERLTSRERLQVAGAALLRLAWRHREMILGNKDLG